jgi:hypothetical protein
MTDRPYLKVDSRAALFASEIIGSDQMLVLTPSFETSVSALAHRSHASHASHSSHSSHASHHSSHHVR